MGKLNPGNDARKYGLVGNQPSASETAKGAETTDSTKTCGGGPRLFSATADTELLKTTCWLAASQIDAAKGSEATARDLDRFDSCVCMDGMLSGSGQRWRLLILSSQTHD